MQITQQRFKQLRKQGYTLEEIGAKYNMSRQRVHQILNYTYTREQAPQPAINQVIYPTINKWLQENNKTPKELAIAANIPYYTLYCFLIGKTKRPQTKTLERLSDYLNIPIPDILKQK